MDLTHCLDRESASVDLKTSLLDVYGAQEDLIQAQQEALIRLLHENAEQEAFINELLKEHLD